MHTGIHAQTHTQKKQTRPCAFDKKLFQNIKMYFWNNFFIPIPLWSTRIPRKVVFLEGLNNISGHFKVRSSQLDLLRGLIDKITTGYICDSNSFQKREMLFIAAFSQNREQFILRFIWSCTFPTYTGWFLFSLPVAVFLAPLTCYWSLR